MKEPPVISKQTSISLAIAGAFIVVAFWGGTTYQRLTNLETKSADHGELIKTLSEVAMDNKRRLDLLPVRQ